MVFLYLAYMMSMDRPIGKNSGS